MFHQQRISVFIIVLGLLIAIGTGLNAHFIHDVKNKDLSFTSNPAISCNINGYTFTHTRETYSDGVVYTEGWWRRPLDPKVKITASTHGFGWASILFYGNIDGQTKGDAQNASAPEKLGSWTALLPFAVGIDNEVQATFSSTFNRSPKTYSWNASGSIKLVPAYWNWTLPPGGEWQEASDIWHTTKSASGSGNWTVAHNWTTLNRASPGNRNSDETSSSSSGSSSGSSSESSSSSGASCSNNPFYDHCTDTGSCTTRSPSGVPGPDCGYNYCCCAPVGSPTDTGDSSGSSSGSSSSSSGCSNNSYYDHCTDTGSCTTGSGSGVPGPECGHNFCCCP